MLGECTDIAVGLSFFYVVVATIYRGNIFSILSSVYELWLVSVRLLG